MQFVNKVQHVLDVCFGTFLSVVVSSLKKRSYSTYMLQIILQYVFLLLDQWNVEMNDGCFTTVFLWVLKKSEINRIKVNGTYIKLQQSVSL